MQNCTTKKRKNSFLIINNMMSLVIGENTYSLSNTHIHYDRILKMLQAKEIRWDRIRKLLDVKIEIESFLNNNGVKADLTNHKITEKESGLNLDSLFNKVLEVYKSNKKDALKLFIKNLKQNPSQESIKQVLDFLSCNELPLTEDGCFYAYKYVNKDYKDCHTGQIDNSVGQIVKMEREGVNPNKNETCSHGLHFCSKEYLKDFSGSHLMCLKVNPRDVVCIPVDYNNSKGRCCQYEVVGEINSENGIKEMKESEIEKYDTILKKQNSKSAKLEKVRVYKSVKECLKNLKRENRKVGMTVIIKNDQWESKYEFKNGIGYRNFVKVESKRVKTPAKEVIKPESNFVKVESKCIKTPVKAPEEDIIKPESNILRVSMNKTGDFIPTFKTVKECLKDLKPENRKVGMEVRIKNSQFDNIYVFENGITNRNLKKKG